MEYLFIIDTDSYAGNFEREMCAYLTNQIGECGVGGRYIESDNPIAKEMKEIVLQKPDKNDCYRPVTIDILNTPKYNSVGIYFDKEPTASQIEVMKQRALEFNKVHKLIKEFKPKDIVITGFRLMEISTTVKELKIS